MVFLTDNRVLADNHRPLPAIMCVQRRGEKIIPTEKDLIQSNIDSFGDDIGKTTNRITAMFEMQARYKPGDREYEILDYRIKCGQHYQQVSIDKCKGIIAKPMPREWFDWHIANKIEDPEKRELYVSLLADRKPYFMRYIYPRMMKEYNDYIKRSNRKAIMDFGKTLPDVLSVPVDERGDEVEEFIKWHTKRLPVGTGDCVVNRICRIFEREFDGYLRRHNGAIPFDYTIMKSGHTYKPAQKAKLEKLMEEFNKKLRAYAVYASRERIRKDDSIGNTLCMGLEFRTACDEVCSNAGAMCDAMLDLCYNKDCTKQFAWSMCKNEIIGSLLQNNEMTINFPVLDPDGDVEFAGKRFTFKEILIGDAE